MGASKVIGGVPVMRYGDPSAVCYIGAVRALLAHLGDPIAEDELIALSGVGLCFPWRVDTPCDEVTVIPEIPQRTFDALGYESEYFGEQVASGTADGAVGQRAYSREFYLGQIRASIDAGRPVVAFGVTNEEPYTCLVVGYDEQGLFTRAFWPPHGEPRDSEAYFHSTDWYEKCAGILVVGARTGERLTGKAAYGRIAEWALAFRCTDSRTVSPAEIPINRAAFPAMGRWLRDDAAWETEEQVRANDIWLRPCGLLLLAYYRDHLYSYLWRLHSEHPGVVNLPALVELERMKRLRESTPYPEDVLGLRDREVRGRLADHVTKLEHCDNSLQWTLFMPDLVKRQSVGFALRRLEYREYPAMRFIGAEGDEYDDAERRQALFAALDALADHRSGFDHDLRLMHHNGHGIDDDEGRWHGVWGRFMAADAPLPEGLTAIDFVPRNPGSPGPPYLSQFAYAEFEGDVAALHSGQGFDCDAMYDVTRNVILGDGVAIPYPELYWTAEVFLAGHQNPSSAYLFSVCARE